MATDILNPQNDPADAAGNQRLGLVTVKTAGRGLNGVATKDTAEHNIAVTGLSTKYDTRFDDPTYYTA
jgi:hypothetical protein